MTQTLIQNEAIITLDKPIKRGESEINKITIRKPNTGALRGVSLSDLLNIQTDAVMVVLPRVSEPTLIQQEINELEPSDLLKAGVVIANFLLPATSQVSLQE